MPSNRFKQVLMLTILHCMYKHAACQLVNNFGAGDSPVVSFALKGIICPYWPNLCNSITCSLIVLEICSNP